MDTSLLMRQAKLLAKAYPALVAKHPAKLPPGAAQDLIAQLYGMPSWDALVEFMTPLTAPSYLPREKGSARGPVYTIRIELLHTQPKVWRQIEVPCDFNFWELHVAIQDAMGWNDLHLHEFHLPGGQRFGIPEPDETVPLASWEHSLAEYLSVGMQMEYLYDFGDDWTHQVVIQEQAPRAAGRYPRCTNGANLAPPDGCGGPPGWEDLKRVMADPRNEEHDDAKEWLRNWGRRYIPLDPHKFNPKTVKFDDPAARFESAFGGLF